MNSEEHNCASTKQMTPNVLKELNEINVHISKK